MYGFPDSCQVTTSAEQSAVCQNITIYQLGSVPTNCKMYGFPDS